MSGSLSSAPESPDDAALRSTARGIADRCRQASEGDHSGCWRALQECGFTELREVDLDGDGRAPLATTTQTVVVVEELARAVCGAPLVGTLLAAELARLAGIDTPAGATVALSGDLAAFAEASSGALAWDAAQPVERAVWWSGQGVQVADVVETRTTQDLSRHVATLAEPSVLGGELDDAGLAELASFARTVLAADVLGAAGAVLDDAVGYAGQRVQFGAPIGSFQAVQHLCGRAFAQVEALRSAVLFAAWALDAGTGHVDATLVAKAYAGRAGVEVAEIATQVFGGVAITWEFRAHRHLRRVWLDAETLGSPSALAPRLVEAADQEETARGLQ